MKTIFLALLLATASLGCMHGPSSTSPDPTVSGEREIFRFSSETDLSQWEIQDDVVMGGRSQGALTLNEAGNAVFSGTVSLENDGGFSSVQHAFGPIDVSAYSAVVLGLKGDGKTYQLRLDATPDARYSYACDFQTSGCWQAIEIPFADLFAIRHGDRLDLPNYPGQTLAQIQILIGNGIPESFRLEIDKIWLK